jgi:hypothetical protein
MKDLVKGKTVKLEDFLKEHEAKLRHTRALYVLEPALDKGNVLKFGIAGTNNGNAHQRLTDYLILYGKHSKTNECLGVNICYCGVTVYNREVQATKSQVAKIELNLKRLAKGSESLEIGRGSERINSTKMSLSAILKLINEQNPDKSDIEPSPRRNLDLPSSNTRKTSQTYRGDKKAYKDSKT